MGFDYHVVLFQLAPIRGLDRECNDGILTHDCHRW